MKKVVKNILKTPLYIADYIRRLYNRQFPVYEELEERLWNESETMRGDNIREGSRHWDELLYVARWVNKNIAAIKAEVSEIQNTNPPQKVDSPKIFMYWEQGFDNAPELVRFLKKRIEKKHASDEIIFLDGGNISSYINFPNKLWDQISKSAHKADLLRLELMVKHGGLWVDATCLSKVNLLEYYSEFFEQGCDFFAPFDVQKNRIRNWLLGSKKGGYIATILLVSWKKFYCNNSYFCNEKSYHFFRWLFESLYFTDESFRKIWVEDSLTENVLPSYQFVRSTKQYYGEINNSAKYLNQHHIHKLTHKSPRNINQNNVVRAIEIAN